MPTYEFRCPKCAVQVTETRALEDLEPYPQCPECDGQLVRLYNFGGVTFNGSGFYKTDKDK